MIADIVNRLGMAAVIVTFALLIGDMAGMTDHMRRLNPVIIPVVAFAAFYAGWTRQS